jgi:D-3-phosphoglycerate dehydrogenase
MTAQEVIELGADVVGMVAGTEKLDSETLKKMPNLNVISRCGAGVDNVDLAYAKDKGIRVCNTPDGPTRAVAELTIGLIINLLRHITRTNNEIVGGIWNKKMGNLLSGKKVGIVGFGRIGQNVASLLKSFGSQLAYYDVVQKESQTGVMFMSLDNLLAWSDIVSLHVSTSSSDKAMIGDNELKKMKKGSWLVNMSRGGVVDEDALYELLKKKHLCAAALDVFTNEPYNGKLCGLDNVILTAHIGSYAKEARIQMEITAVENLLKGLEESGK